MIKKLFTILALLFLLGACSSSDDSNSNTTINPKILNGTPVDESIAPQIVELVLIDISGETNICSGFVLDKNHVLTAGHCASDDIIDIRVKSGDMLYPVLNRYIPTTFREDLENLAIFSDIAVLETPELLLPALPILVSIPVEIGTQIITFGFGLDEQNQAGSLKNGASLLDIVTDNHLFSPEFFGKGTNPCNGDSGAPAVVSFTSDNNTIETAVVGLVSSGTTDNCQDGDRTLYTNLQNPEIVSFILNYAPGTIIK